MQESQIPRPGKRRKSVRLAEAEFASLEKYTKRFGFLIECAETIGVSREVLSRVLLAKSGAPETIEKIRKVL